ncbi:MAG: hypothetical protein RLZZ04_2245 [Cyanobacteriota bacterium]|jgi:DNA-binding NarL/FixJ family response regulator
MIKVLVVDDQKTVQEIIKTYIEADPGLELVGCAGDGKEAIELIEIYHPDVVLMDIEMPIMDGLEATQIISEQFVNTNVLIISVHNEDSYLDNALQVGAKGYLKKNTPEKELINAIYSSYKGFFQLGPGLLEQYLYKANKAQSNSQEIEQLKSVILQQSKLLDNLNNGRGGQYRNVESKSAHSNERINASLENRCSTLEKQVYYLSTRLEKLNKKTVLNQQLSVLVVLSCGFVVIGFLMSILI